MSQDNSGGAAGAATEFDSLFLSAPGAPTGTLAPAGATATEPTSDDRIAVEAELAAWPASGSAMAADEPGGALFSGFDFAGRPKPLRPRTSILGWSSLALAFLAPPVGLVLSIAARIYEQHRHGWRTWPVTVATVVSIVLSAFLVVGGALYGIQATEQAGVDAIIADSAPFCAELAGTPGVLNAAGYGWPTESLSVNKSIEAMTAFRDRWVELAAIAPSGVVSGVTAIADTAGALVDNAESTRSVDRQRNLDQMILVTSSSGIPAYTKTYCS